MSGLAGYVCLARDVLTQTSRGRILWVYLLLGALVTVPAVWFTGISPDGAGWQFEVFGQPISHAELPEDAALALAVRTTLAVVLVNAMVTFGVLLGLIATANAVGSAFEPGAAELILPRPVSRGGVVLARFAGALAFGALQAGWVVGLAVVLAGLRHGVWPAGVLLVAPALVLKMAVLLAICTLVVVASRSRVLGLGAALGAWVTSWLVNNARIDLGTALAGAEASLLDQIVWAQRLVPQVTLLDHLALTACGQPPPTIPWYDPWVVVVQAAVWVAVPLALTVLVVSRRDH